METVALCMGVITGVLTAVVTAYGLHRTWQDRRREQRARLADAARVAVRITDAAYVRPLLRARLEACVQAFLIVPDPDHHATTARLRLFCRLQPRFLVSMPSRDGILVAVCGAINRCMVRKSPKRDQRVGSPPHPHAAVVTEP
jgi:hypothetical protein